jgi:hypothetical protein
VSLIFFFSNPLSNVSFDLFANFLSDFYFAGG